MGANNWSPQLEQCHQEPSVTQLDNPYAGSVETLIMSEETDYKKWRMTTIPREAYYLVQSYLQELLGSVELPGEGWYAGASLGVSQDSTHCSTHSKVNEVLGELHIGSTEGHLDVNKTRHKVRQQ